MKKLLQELSLEQEVVNKILNLHNAKLEDLQTSKTELEKALELSKQEILTRDKQLQELSKVDIENLQETIKSYEKANKELLEKHSLEIEKIKTDYAIEKALTSAGARNLKATKSLLDLDKISLDKEGNVTGIDEQIKALLSDENSSFMFKTSNDSASIKGTKAFDSADQTPTKDISKMSYLELNELMKNEGVI